MVFMECLDYVLKGAYKAGVVLVKLDDGLINTGETHKNLQRCITWTNKSHKREHLLEAPKQHLHIPRKRMLTIIPTRFVYLVH